MDNDKTILDGVKPVVKKMDWKLKVAAGVVALAVAFALVKWAFGA